MQQNEEGPSVLEYLSFETDRTITMTEQEIAMPTTPLRSSSSIGPSGSSNRSMHMQGILWKRRDVFRNRWRPRWFVLHSDQRVLTYYLLANQETERVVSGGTPSRRTRSAGAAFATPSSSSISVASGAESTRSHIGNRRRTFSESSNASAHTIDCDVVPRGTIYLLGSTVEANEALTRSQEDLYALTITDHENATHCHLAARTIESRNQWIQRIRQVCQSGNGAQPPERRQVPRTPYSPQTPFMDRTGSKSTVAKTGGLAREENWDQHHPSVSRQNDHLNDTNGTAGKDLGGEENSLREKEILIVFAPIVLYKALTMMSLFGLAALCFVVTSAMALRWVLIQQLFRVVKPFTDDEDQDDTSRVIGHGSICCRLTVNLANASLSRTLVWSLAEAIRRQPRLVSRKYSLLPRFYSTDVAYLDLKDENTDESDVVWVSKADEKNLNEIADYFTATKEQKHSPVGFLQQTIGPACRVVSTSVAKTDDGRDPQEVHLELNLIDCPITVFVSRPSRTQEVSISINFQSTDVHACRKFAEDFQTSIRSAKI